jgi:ABC-2 type transport system ATP-binding protein
MIEIRGLRKSFRTGRGRRASTAAAVRGIDLTVHAGEIFGFLGPNGAGKTTTLRMLATLLKPDGGTATIAGADLLREADQVRRQIGYVPQTGGTNDRSTARQELVLQARMYGIGKAEALVLAAAALEAFQLTDFADRIISTYSGGQRRRVDVSLGVIHRPRLLFLDEPTAGLDPPSRSRMWQEVRRLRADGMTIFLTTHYLDEADALCDRISIIDHGEIVAEGTPDELKRGISGDVVTVGLASARPSGAAVVGGATVDASPDGGDRRTPLATKLLEAEPFVRKVEVPEEGSLRLYVDSGATAIPQIIRALAGGGIEPGTIELRRPTLDDVFLAKTGRSLET